MNRYILKTSLAAIALALLLTIASLAVPGRVARAETWGDFTYTVSGGSATITKYSGTATAISVPEEMDGYSVTAIGDSAFKNFSAIKSVTIASGVTRIGNYAFSGCSGLTSVSLPSTLTSIGNYVFSGCSSLATVTIPADVTSIGSSAFQSCNAKRYATIGSSGANALGQAGYSFCDMRYPKLVLKMDSQTNELTIVAADSNITRLDPADYPSGITAIGEEAFQGNSSLTSVVIPPSVTTIGDWAFSGCNRMVNVEIPGSVTNFGNWVFHNCSRLASVTLPQTVTSIGYRMFYGCSNLNAVTLPQNITSIGSGMFSGCSSLTGLTIPSSVTNIGSYAFYGCTRLTRLAIPENVTNIGGYAFQNCTGLTAMTIPPRVTSIADYVFAGCSALTSVDVHQNVTSIGHHAFDGCRGLTELPLHDGIGSIGSYAFYGCTGVSKVVIPDSVTKLNDNTFGNCRNRLNVFVPNSVQDIHANAFGSIAPVIYCYRGSAAHSWGQGKNCTVLLIDGPDFADEMTVTLPQQLILLVGDTQDVEYECYPMMPGMTAQWASSNPAVATVNEGLVSARSIGETTITLTAGGKTAECLVRVVPPLDDFSLEDVWLIVRSSAQVTVTGIDPQNTLTEWVWSTGNQNCAVVDANGLISGRAVGETTVTLRDALSGKSSTATVHVCNPVTAVSFAPASAQTKVGRRLQLTANVSMGSQRCVNQLVAFTSGDASVATVDESGLVTAHAVGQTTIPATAASGVSGTFRLTVGEPDVLRLPAALKTIEAEAFARDASLWSVVIPAGCTAIGDRAFAYCANLSDITIPASVRAISASAFEGCGDVTFHCPAGSVAENYARSYGFEVLPLD